ncbi:TonB-dependent receptor [Sphingomonas sp. NFR15]|uniref:TonB-dependent receptor n=1 Tax=Sphingomonas sp. NFR15 TaxID=1566282 RepID=UPI00088369E6|nr:TonB-dependent receptor [Sphingomonas sp. NFR15]SDA36913.1 Secretin and TonB N terminus short domain-containing protein [Sphingomonas sp. NFR15]
MTEFTARRWSALRGVGAIVLVLAALPSVAQARPAPMVFSFRIAAGSLQHALVTFASVTGEQLLYSTELVAGRQAAGLDGRLSADQALDRLLDGTGLVAQRVGPRIIVLRPRDATAGDPAGTGSDAEASAPSAGGAVASAQQGGQDPSTIRDIAPADTAHDDIIVTGTHLRGGAAGSPPVERLTRDDLDRRGFASVAQALQALPGNFGGMANEQSALAFADTSGSNGGFATGVNLRGLGAGATLVLVNGQRLGGSGTKGAFADVTSIPTGALDRVEVLMDGASAIYGSDAVGGVVNILLKRHFKGAETRVRFGSVTSGGKRDVQIDQTLGTQWSSGGVMLSYEYDQSGRLASVDRAFARSSDSRSLGGTDHRYIYSLPGNVIGINPVTGAFGAAYAIPSGQDGTALTPGAFLAGATNLQNSRIDTDLIPRQARHSVYATFDQDVGAGLHVTADARYAHRAFDARLAGSAAIIEVTAANPYFVSPTGASSDLIAYSLAPELGPTDTHGYAEALATSFGLDADLGSDWKLRGYAAFAQEREFNESRNLVNTAALAEATGSIADDPATPFSTAEDGFFNPYGTGQANSTTILGFVGEGYSRSRTRSRVLTGHVDADGSLFSVPGGTVRLAIGGDVRRETFRRSGESLLSSAMPVATANVAASRLIEAGFVEAQVPIVGASNATPMVRRLDVSLALRVEHYDDFGTTTNPKVGVAWVPLAGVTLRSSFGTSFRAPNLRELRDPEQYSVTTLVRSGASVPVIQLSGGNPGLRPEKAQSWTAGVDIDPAAIPRLHLNATWFGTVFKQRVATPASANFANALSDSTLAPFVELVSPNSNAADLARVTALLNDPAFTGGNSFPPTSIAAIVDTRYVNTGKVDVSGIDLTARYMLPIGANEITLSGNGSYLLHYREQVTPTAMSVDRINRVGQPVDLRGRLSVGWSQGALNAQFGLNYVAPYHDLVGNPINAWKTLDLQLGYRAPEGSGALEGVAIALSAQNLLDRAPPFYDSPVGVGYDAANADALGRYVSVQLTKRW